MDDRRKRPADLIASGLTASILTGLLGVFLLPAASAEFVSACGRAPSGLNNCPWYQVEVVIFRNDNARDASAEELVGEAEPRWTPRLATLLPPVGEDIRPMRTAEHLALWESAGQAPEWFEVTPGLTPEQERSLMAIEDAGDQSAWNDQEPGDGMDAPADVDAADSTLIADQLLPEPEPELELIEVPPPAGAIPMDLAFREVPAGQRLLNGEAARLRRARGFEVLSHLAWRQPFIPNEPGLAQLVYTADLAESGLPQGELLLGSLTVDLRRFLHAHLDLYFKAPARDAFGSGRDALVTFDPQRWIHVRQSRRMRSGELHYVDHPWIGAIIRIERYEAPLLVD